MMVVRCQALEYVVAVAVDSDSDLIQPYHPASLDNLQVEESFPESQYQ
jgi:hypothetical protein